MVEKAQRKNQLSPVIHKNAEKSPLSELFPVLLYDRTEVCVRNSRPLCTSKIFIMFSPWKQIKVLEIYFITWRTPSKRGFTVMGFGAQFVAICKLKLNKVNTLFHTPDEPFCRAAEAQPQNCPSKTASMLCCLAK